MTPRHFAVAGTSWPRGGCSQALHVRPTAIVVARRRVEVEALILQPRAAVRVRVDAREARGVDAGATCGVKDEGVTSRIDTDATDEGHRRAGCHVEQKVGAFALAESDAYRAAGAVLVFD